MNTDDPHLKFRLMSQIIFVHFFFVIMSLCCNTIVVDRVTTQTKICAVIVCLCIATMALSAVRHWPYCRCWASTSYSVIEGHCVNTACLASLIVVSRTCSAFFDVVVPALLTLNWLMSLRACSREVSRVQHSHTSVGSRWHCSRCFLSCSSLVDVGTPRWRLTYSARSGASDHSLSLLVLNAHYSSIHYGFVREYTSMMTSWCCGGLFHLVRHKVGIIWKTLE